MAITVDESSGVILIDELCMVDVLHDLEREKMVKRLNAYLKRYGLSKIRSWTYLSD